MDEKLKDFAELLEKNYMASMVRQYGDKEWVRNSSKVTIKPRRKYTCVDVGDSGKYMIVNATGEIFGIKAYGVIHRGHRYGTLDTIHEWDWAGYVARRWLKIWDECQTCRRPKNECICVMVPY